jgi:hypothetical protein
MKKMKSTQILTWILKINNILVFFVLIGLFSCEFEPTGEYYLEEIEKPDSPPTLNIDLSLEDTSDIIFYDNYNITISFKNNDVAIKEVYFYLDDRQINTSYDNGAYIGYFNIYESEYNTSHKFKIEIYTSSGSNSLADDLDAETYIFTSREWTFIYKDPDPYIIPQQNGFIELSPMGAELSWVKYEGITFDFHKYLIEKEGSDLSVLINDTSFIDRSYIGERTIYHIYLTDLAGNKLLWASTQQVEKDIPELQLTDSNMQMALSWSESRFVNNIKEYQIKYQVLNSNSWEELGSFSNETTSIILKDHMVFEWLTRYQFIIEPIPVEPVSVPEPTPMFTDYSHSHIMTMAFPSFAFNEVYGVNSKGMVYLDASTVNLHHPLSNEKSELIDYLPGPKDGAANSPDGNYFIVSTSEYELTLYSVDPFIELKIISLQGLTNSIRNMQITNNGIASFITEDFLVIYDMINEKYILNETKESTLYKFIFSSIDGQHFIIHEKDNAEIYKYANGNFQQVKYIESEEIEFTINHFFKCVNEPDKFILYGINSNLEIRSMSDFSLIESREIPSGEIISFDTYNNQYLVWDNNYFNVYELDSGIKKASVPINPTAGGSIRYNTQLMGNTIFMHSSKLYFN